MKFRSFFVSALLFLFFLGNFSFAQVTVAMITGNVVSWTESPSKPFYYRIDVGSNPGGSDYGTTGLLLPSAIGPGPVQSFDLDASTAITLPTDGSTAYVRIWFYSAGWKKVDLSFSAMGTPPPMPDPIELLSPTCGGLISGGCLPFTWTPGDFNVLQWILYIGSNLGGSDIFQSPTIPGSTTGYIAYLPEVLPPTVHARLWYFASPGGWAKIDCEFTTATPVCSGGDFIISLGQDSGPGTLREAVMLASPGNTICLQVNVCLDTEIVIDKDLTIQTPGSPNLNISGQGITRIFHVLSGVTLNLDSINLNGGNAVGATLSGSGGAILNNGTLNMINTGILLNTAEEGGGIFSDGPAVTMITSTISGNEVRHTSSTRGGGLAVNGGTIDIVDSTFESNSTEYIGTVGGFNADGGAIHARGGASLNILGGVFSSNMTESSFNGGVQVHGGAIYQFDGTLSLTGVTLENNKAVVEEGGAEGGGIKIEGSGSLTLTDCHFNSNSAEKNGTGTLEVVGGALHLEGIGFPTTVTACTFDGNKAISNFSTNGPESNGGAIFKRDSSPLMIFDSIFTNNEVTSIGGSARGGAIYIIEGTLGINGCTFDGNLSTFDGNTNRSAAGAAFCQIGTSTFTTIADSLFVNNVVENTGTNTSTEALGGAIYKEGLGSILVSGTTTVQMNTTRGVNGNARGGGIYFFNAGNMNTISGCTIEQNISEFVGTPSRAGRGGGIAISGSTTGVMISGCTIAENIARCTSTNTSSGAFGGGISNSSSGTISITGTTISSNSTLSSGGHSRGAGLATSSGTMSVMSCTMEMNLADFVGTSSSDALGGGIYQEGNSSSLTLTSTTVSENVARTVVSTDFNSTAFGGGLYKTGTGTLLLESSTSLASNRVTSSAGDAAGGGIYITSGSLVLNASSVDSNVSEYLGTLNRSALGGGIFQLGDTTTCTIQMGSSVDANTCTNTSTNTSANSRGGGIFKSNDGSVLVETGSSVNENSISSLGGASEGGGIFINDGSLILDMSSLDENLTEYSGTTTGDAHGGGLFQSGNVTTVQIRNSSSASFNLATNNSTNAASEARGAGLYKTNDGSLSVLSSAKIDSNITSSVGSQAEGGGIFINGGSLIVDSAEVNSNEVSYVGTASKDAHGGGIYQSGNTTSVEVRNSSTVSSNKASNTSTVSGAETRGGGIFKNGNGTTSILSTSEINENELSSKGGSSFGGGIYMEGGMLTVDASHIDLNKATITDAINADTLGGGLFQSASTSVVEIRNGSSVNQNECENLSTHVDAEARGGAIFKTNTGTITLLNSTASQNTIAASGGHAEGGGLYADNGTITVTTSTLDQNSVSHLGSTRNAAGGGIEASGSALTMTVDGGSLITNNTVSNPRTGGLANGGGLNKSGTSSVTLNGVTFQGNTLSAPAGTVSGGAFRANSSGFVPTTVTVNPPNTAPDVVVF